MELTSYDLHHLKKFHTTFSFDFFHYFDLRNDFKDFQFDHATFERFFYSHDKQIHLFQMHEDMLSIFCIKLNEPCFFLQN